MTALYSQASARARITKIVKRLVRIYKLDSGCTKTAVRDISRATRKYCEAAISTAWLDRVLHGRSDVSIHLHIYETLCAVLESAVAEQSRLLEAEVKLLNSLKRQNENAAATEQARAGHARPGKDTVSNLA